MEELDTSVLRILTAKFELGLFEQPYAPEGPVEHHGDDGRRCRSRRRAGRAEHRPARERRHSAAAAAARRLRSSDRSATRPSSSSRPTPTRSAGRCTASWRPAGSGNLEGTEAFRADPEGPGDRRSGHRGLRPAALRHPFAGRGDRRPRWRRGRRRTRLRATRVPRRRCDRTGGSGRPRRRHRRPRAGRLQRRDRRRHRGRGHRHRRHRAARRCSANWLTRSPQPARPAWSSSSRAARTRCRRRCSKPVPSSWRRSRGQAGTRALARVLFGEVNPGGKLPYSIPRHGGQFPVYHYQRADSGYRREAVIRGMQYLRHDVRHRSTRSASAAATPASTSPTSASPPRSRPTASSRRR